MKTTATIIPDPASNQGTLVWDQEAARSNRVAPTNENTGNRDGSPGASESAGIQPGHYPSRLPLYGFIVDHPVRGWIRVGHVYRDRAVAASWRPFLKSAWHGLPTRLIQVASLLSASPRSAPSQTGGAANG